MNFVKTQIYKQDITKKGIKETEEDARTKQELEHIERLKGLPEFQKDENFLSLSEQLERNKKEKGKGDEADDVDCNDESLLTELPYLNEEEYLNSFLHFTENSDYKIEKIKELETIKKEYEEAKNNVLKKKKEKELSEKKEEDLLLEELKNLKKVKKIVKKEKKIKKSPIFPIKSIIKVKPNQEEITNDKDIKSGASEKKNKDVNENSKNTLSSLLSGYSDESD